MAGAAGVAPFSYWISDRWGLVALVLCAIGAVFLGFGWQRHRASVETVDPHLDIPPGQARDDLRGFPGARVLDASGSHGDQPDT